MVKLLRPRETVTLTGGRGFLNPQVAALPEQAQAEQGQAVFQANARFFQQAQKADAEAQFSKANREATLSFMEAILERESEKFDADGNPTFGTLSDDVGRLGQGIKQQASSRISNPAAKKKFDSNFSNLITNQQISSLRTARQDQLNFIKEEERAGFKDYSRLAGEAADPTDEKFFTDLYFDILDNSDGAFSKFEIEDKKDAFRREVGILKVDRAAQENPLKTLEILQSDPGFFNLTEEEAEKAIVEVERQLQGQREIAVIQYKRVISLGEGQPGDIEKLFNDGIIDERQKEKLLTDQLNFELRESKKHADIEEVSNLLTAGGSLASVKPSSINKHYEVRLAQVIELKGAPLTLAEQTEIAAQYRVPVTNFNKTLATILVDGDLESAADAVASYDFLAIKSPNSLANFSRRASAIASYAADLIGNAKNLNPTEAVRIARNKVLHDSDPIRQSRIAEIKALKKGELEELVEEAFNDNDTDPDVVKRATNLYKEAFIMQGDFDSAKRLMREWVGRFAGESVFASEKGNIMWGAPESLYPDVDVELLQEDLESDVRDKLNIPEGMDIEIQIKADDFTTDITNKDGYGSYHVFVFDPIIKGFLPLFAEDGTFDRWEPDIDAIAEQQIINEREEKKEEQEFDESLLGKLISPILNVLTDPFGLKDGIGSTEPDE